MVVADGCGVLVASVGSLVMREVSAGRVAAVRGGRVDSLFRVEWVPVDAGPDAGPDAGSGAGSGAGWVLVGGDELAGVAGLLGAGSVGSLDELPGLGGGAGWCGGGCGVGGWCGCGGGCVGVGAVVVGG